MAHKRRRLRQTTRRTRTRRTLALVAAVAALATAAIILILHPWSPAASQPRALIADSLSEDYPNQALINRIARILEEAGYKVDIYVNESVDLDLYARLTNYNLIILRVHGGKAVYRGPDGKLHKINGLFTGLPWRQEYMELKREWLATRAYPYNMNKTYLAVLPRFFQQKLHGTFKPGTVMIVASCYSLYTTQIADVLAEKGLSAFIGWRGPVTLQHMDEALEKLVEKAIGDHEPWPQAVAEVNRELGPDPLYNETLKIIVYK
ncbi:MAG: hypothetical protein ABWW69_07860 [Pyrodictiaceae archaeon]